MSRQWEPSPLSLRDRFVVPPFSVLDARQGYWQDRKRAWLSLGIESELGRGGASKQGRAAIQDGVIRPLSERRSPGRSPGRGRLQNSGPNSVHRRISGNAARGHTRVGKGHGQANSAVMAAITGRLAPLSVEDPVVSIFDPVLCELTYRWFCPPGGSVLDPFAGGSVRGIVAGWLGHPYLGLELLADQVEANRAQACRIISHPELRPKYRVGDARQLLPRLPEQSTDLVFTCPPYYNLEVYSDDPRDLSRKRSYAEFLEGYGDIIHQAAARLRPNRFAVFVVGEVRSPSSGFYYGLVPDTIRLCEEAGLRYFNEAILVTQAGTLPMRSARPMQLGRKLGKTHQNVLVFYNGRQQAIGAEFGQVVPGPAPVQELEGVAA